jgi:hypothetical protein
VPGLASFGGLAYWISVCPQIGNLDSTVFPRVGHFSAVPRNELVLPSMRWVTPSKGKGDRSRAALLQLYKTLTYQCFMAASCGGGKDRLNWVRMVACQVLALPLAAMLPWC